MATERDQFLQSWEQEHAKTRKLMGTIPEGTLDFKPHPKSMSTGELAWHLVGLERFFVEGCLAGKIEPGPFPPVPKTLKEILETFDRQHAEMVQKIKKADEKLLVKPLQIPMGPKQVGELPAMAILWMGVVMHGCHHRGQLSVHARMLDAKVPSIYGPSLDEPWW